MKLTVWRVLLFFLVILLSVGFGFAFDAGMTAYEKHSYPRPDAYAESVSEYSAQFGVPEAVIWSVIRTESNFSSSARDADGSTGLMKLTPETFEYICKELLGMETAEDGLLYDPETNLRAGVCYLSHLYEIYGLWDSVYAAWDIGCETVDAWLLDSDYVSEQGKLQNIPDAVTRSFVERAVKAQALYTKLYE